LLVDFSVFAGITLSMEYSSEKAKKTHQAAEKNSAHNKMVMMEKAMQGKNAGKHDSKNFRGKEFGKSRK